MSKVMEEILQHFLFPSAVFAERAPHHVQTILGSCVSVCLFDINLNFGGINHFMLPWWNCNGLPSAKYGDVAMEQLLKRMEFLGSTKRNLIAKVFGGAHQHSHKSNPQTDIGARNIEVAIKFLEEQQIPIVASSVGGELGRKVVFHTSASQVYVRIFDKPE
jgi:chemotaxis protein CheD